MAWRGVARRSAVAPAVVAQFPNSLTRRLETARNMSLLPTPRVAWLYRVTVVFSRRIHYQLMIMLTTVTGSVLLEASHVGGHREEARFPCEFIAMELNLDRPSLTVRGIAARHVSALSWTADRISFSVPEFAQLWTFHLRESPIVIGPRAVRFRLASALPFANALGDV